MKNPEFLIIGSGPGGSAAALKLVRAGRRVLMIERGGFLPKEEANRDSNTVYGEKRYRTAERWLNQERTEFQPWMHFYVGGNAKLYGSAHYRFRKADFQEIEYSDGTSPAWVINSGNLERYYDEAEALYHVHGQREADVTEPTERPYPLQPLEDEEGIATLKRGLDELGISHLPLPLGVQLGQENEGFETDLTAFDAYPDPSLSKAEPEACVLDRLEGEFFELMTETEAVAFLSSGSEITGVKVKRGGGEEVLRADHYLCAAGAIQSAKLFLQSGPDRTFGNRSGLVGRNYMAHISTTTTARFKEEIPDTFAKTFGSNHWYQPDAGGAVLGSIQTQGKWDACQYGLEPWTHEKGSDLEHVARHSLEFFFMTEDLPLKSNEVRVTAEGKVQIIRKLTNEKESRGIVDVFEEALRNLPPGSLTLEEFRRQLLPVDWCTHQCGTLVFGEDPDFSVLDPWCRTHDFQNLHVVDASFMPSSSALNPTLTIIANSLRVGERLAMEA